MTGANHSLQTSPRNPTAYDIPNWEADNHRTRFFQFSRHATCKRLDRPAKERFTAPFQNRRVNEGQDFLAAQRSGATFAGGHGGRFRARFSEKQKHRQNVAADSDRLTATSGLRRRFSQVHGAIGELKTKELPVGTTRGRSGSLEVFSGAANHSFVGQGHQGFIIQMSDRGANSF
jgi:hypothetical protein